MKVSRPILDCKHSPKLDRYPAYATQSETFVRSFAIWPLDSSCLSWPVQPFARVPYAPPAHRLFRHTAAVTQHADPDRPADGLRPAQAGGARAVTGLCLPGRDVDCRDLGRDRQADLCPVYPHPMGYSRRYRAEGRYLVPGDQQPSILGGYPGADPDPQPAHAIFQNSS